MNNDKNLCTYKYLMLQDIDDSCFFLHTYSINILSNYTRWTTNENNEKKRQMKKL